MFSSIHKRNAPRTSTEWRNKNCLFQLILPNLRRFYRQTDYVLSKSFVKVPRGNAGTPFNRFNCQMKTNNGEMSDGALQSNLQHRPTIGLFRKYHTRLLTGDVVLAVVVGVRHRMQSSCGPALVPALLVVVTTPFSIFAQIMDLLPSVQVSGTLKCC